jgi:glycosidase
MSNSFQPVDWSHDSNIYEINIRQYTQEGTFKAFENNLPRLRDMGVEILWFMPITPISLEKRKGSLGSYYACSDYTSINPEYGTLEDFKNLVRSAQSMGFKVIIDWVANHTGWDHHWTREHPEFYVKDPDGNFTEIHGWDDVIDLNYTNSGLRQAMKEAMKFWIDTCGIDGFRCDMAHLVPLDFWVEARTYLDQFKKLFWLAECEEATYHGAFDTTYTWRWMHVTEEFAQDKSSLSDLWGLLQQYQEEFPANAYRAYFTSNHDENTWNGTEYEKYGDFARNLAVFSCLWNGIPLIYSGQEMPNHKRLKFFDRDPIEWNGRFDLHDFYKTLLNLRKCNPALRAGDQDISTIKTETSGDNRVFSFLRKKGDREVLVALNFTGEQLSFEWKGQSVNGTFKRVFQSETRDFTQDKGAELDAWDFLIFEK